MADNITQKLNQYQMIPFILDAILAEISPQKIILFGSCANKYINKNSDIDLCIVLDKTVNQKQKREMRSNLLEILLNITDYEVDLLICSNDEWQRNDGDESTFIGKISKGGELLYGR